MRTPNTWDECKTKEEREAFKRRLKKLEEKGTYISVEEAFKD